MTVFGSRVGVAALPSKCSLMESVREGKEEGAPRQYLLEICRSCEAHYFSTRVATLGG